MIFKKDYIWTKAFWKYAVTRAIHTMAQTAVAVIGTAFVLADVDWKIVISASALSGIVSILKSIAVGVPEMEVSDGE